MLKRRKLGLDIDKGAFKAEIDNPKDNLFIIFRIERGDHGLNWSDMEISLETNMTDETMNWPNHTENKY